MQLQKKYVFVGNREYVLREMIKIGLIINDVWVIKDSFLHKRLLKDHFIDYSVITSKADLIEKIESTDFDVLISNGCKYILPVSQLKESKGRSDLLFVNIHPSYLPDLKGMDPINGACLYGRNGGATCHLMDDGIDSGAIISRVEIPMSLDIDAGLLFQLSFKAEVDVFRHSYDLGFNSKLDVCERDDYIYYSISDEDMILNCNRGVDYLLRQSRAFGYRSKGISMMVNNEKYSYYGAEEITNEYVKDLFKNIPEKCIGLAFEDSVIFKLEGRIVRLNRVNIENTSALEGLYIE